MNSTSICKRCRGEHAPFFSWQIYIFLEKQLPRGNPELITEPLLLLYDDLCTSKQFADFLICIFESVSTNFPVGWRNAEEDWIVGASVMLNMW